MLKRFTFFLLLNFFFQQNIQAQWSVICNTGNGFVDNFEIYNNELYATGFFTSLCGNPYSYIAKYDGNSWQPVGNGLQESGHSLKTINNELYAVRYEQQIDSNWLYKFDGNDFQKFGEGVYLTNAVVGFSQTANLYNVIDYANKITVCGEFNRAGNKLISGIMQWNGSGWDSLGAGLSGNITGTAPVMYPHDMCIFNNDLIVAGNFKIAGGQLSNGIARWDGSQWHSLATGFNSTVYGVCVFNGELYAGGDFTMSGTNAVNYIAKWDGTNWIDPGFSFFYINPNDYTFIHTLKVINNNLFISGGFNRAVIGSDTLLCSAIVSYDGTNIDTLDGGLAGKEAEAISFFNGTLFAGGGLFGSSYIASYDLITSLSSHENKNSEIEVFPNPSSSSIHVKSKKAIDQIQVFNDLGQLIYSCFPKESNVHLDLQKQGIYLVKILSEGKKSTKKIMISIE